MCFGKEFNLIFEPFHDLLGLIFFGISYVDPIFSHLGAIGIISPIFQDVTTNMTVLTLYHVLTVKQHWEVIKRGKAQLD